MIVSDFNHVLEEMNEVLQGGHPHLELGTEHHCDPPVLSLCVFLLTRCGDLLFYTSRAMCFGRNAYTQWFAQDRLQSFAPPSEGRPSSAAPLSRHFFAWIVLNLKGDSGRLSNPQGLSNSRLPPGVGVAGRARNLRNLQPKRNLRNHSSKMPPTLSI